MKKGNGLGAYHEPSGRFCAYLIESSEQPNEVLQKRNKLCLLRFAQMILDRSRIATRLFQQEQINARNERIHTVLTFQI